MPGRTLACLLLSTLLSMLPPALFTPVMLPAGAQLGAAGVANAVVVTLTAPADREASADVAPRQAMTPPESRVTAAAAPAVDAATAPASDDGTPAATDAASDEGAAYLPAAQLTERPQLLRDIAPDWPAQDRLPQRMVCTLLVSEHGDVDRVLCDEPVVSPATLQAVGERFRAARFAPGRLYGRPVRSALRIELRLD